MNTLTEFVTLVTTSCCTCGVRFAIPDEMIQNRRDYGAEFFCPNGHSLRYTKPRCQKLQEELDQKQRELTAVRCESLRLKTEKAEVEQRLSRHVSRPKNGVCPCCSRSFINLRRHLATKHPGYSTKSQ